MEPCIFCTLRYAILAYLRVLFDFIDFYEIKAYAHTKAGKMLHECNTFVAQECALVHSILMLCEMIGV